ncbi:MAG: hypothetical protein GC168_08605 [Candidatus Hydrogenedens sp.]|nr:hypothetical protein [Candidatus Hydrogenedens sp.]
MMAVSALPPTLQAQAYHTHGGVVHTHAAGAVEHAYHGFDPAPGWFPHVHGPSTGGSEGGDAEHVRLSADEIRARMVPVRPQAPDSPPSSSQEKPRPFRNAPPAKQHTPDHSQYCSLAQVPPLPVDAFVWHPPAAPAFAPAVLPNTEHAAVLLSGISGRAPPRAA